MGVGGWVGGGGGGVRWEGWVVGVRGDLLTSGLSFECFPRERTSVTRCERPVDSEQLKMVGT